MLSYRKRLSALALAACFFCSAGSLPVRAAEDEGTETILTIGGGESPSLTEALNNLPNNVGALHIQLVGSTDPEQRRFFIPLDKGITEVVIESESNEYQIGTDTAALFANGIPLTFKSGKLHDLYGGGYNQLVQNTNLTIQGGCVSWIYGGGQAEDGDAQVTGCASVLFDNAKMIYSNEAYSDEDYVWGGGSAKNGNASVAEAHLTIQGTTMRREMYAGAYTGYNGNGSVDTSTIDIAGSTLHGDVFGSGGAEATGATATVAHARITIENSDLISENENYINDDKGSIYGGGFADNAASSTSDVLTDCTIQIKHSSIYELYGGPIAMSSKTCSSGVVDIALDNTTVLGNLYTGGVSYDGVAVANVQRATLTLRNGIEFLDEEGGHIYGEGFVVEDGSAPVLEGTTLQIESGETTVRGLHNVETVALASDFQVTDTIETPQGGSLLRFTTPDAALSYTGAAPSESWFHGETDGALTYSAEADGAAIWRNALYTLTATAGEHGSISPAGAVSVAPGESQTFTITPDAGYVVSSVLVDGAAAALTGNAYTFTDVNADHTIAVAFAQKPSGGGSGGSSSTPAKPPVTTTPEGDATLRPQTTVSGDGAHAEVSASDAKQLAAAASDGAVVIAPTVRDDTAQVEVALTGEAARTLADSSAAGVTVETPAAEVTLPREALSALAGQSQKQISVSAQTQEDGATRITVRADEQTVDRVPGGVRAALPAVDTSPGVVALVLLPDGTEQVVRKSAPGDGAVSVPLPGSATVRLENRAVSFPDSDSTWAKDAVDFATARGLMNGERADAFAPDAPMTRGMFATVLYRLEDEPGAGAAAFTDVAPDAYYAEAAAWAGEAGLIRGVSQGVFDPGSALTREQLAVILYHYAAPEDAAAAGSAPFADRDAVSPWAAQAVDWCADAGLLQGRGGKFAPAEPVTRAEAAAILQRLVCDGFV